MPEILPADVDQIALGDVVKCVETLDRRDGDWLALNLAFLRNVTLDPVVPWLKYLGYREGIRVNVSMGNYDTVVQDVLEVGSTLYRHRPDAIAICLKMENLSPRLAAAFWELSTRDVEAEADRVLGLADRLLCDIRRTTPAMVMLHTFETPVHPDGGILDYQQRLGQVGTFRRINAQLCELAGRHENAYLVDMDLLQSAVGRRHFFDPRYWHIGKAPYTTAACRAIAGEYMKLIRPLRGRNRKCLVLDCDNTLWGGVVGEDGLHGIRISTTWPGSAYRDFQQAVLGLYHRGIVLAISSKNNQSDVLEVLEQHPEMLLRKDHFAAMRINWQDKAQNLREIAAELNLGTDALVFVDDSPAEIELVRKMLPEVRTIALPADPCRYADLLKASGLFDTLTLSEEDRRRNRMYLQQRWREEARDEFSSGDLEDYYRHLQMQVRVAPADAFSMARAAQLSQRTNQFNLTTIRYSEAEIRQLARSPQADVRLLRLKDRFGDSGIVGMAILRYDRGAAIIDSFLLSCRVIGRGVEDVLLAACFRAAAAQRCRTVTGWYRPTGKNAPAAEFYRRRGFDCVETDADAARYEYPLGKKHPEPPDYFQSVTFDESLPPDDDQPTSQEDRHGKRPQTSDR